MAKTISAAMLAIGDELLSGRTKDKNIGTLADVLTLNAIDLTEVRIVADDEPAIVEALNALRKKYDYVFTSGGIGPTHDDITADAVAAAFRVGISHHDEAMALLGASYAERGIEFTEARKRMARVPHGGELIQNRVSVAPGFRIENVFVMAGVPSVFQAMLDEVLPTLETGTAMLSERIECKFPEGTIGGPLGDIQKDNPETSIGSYPKFDGKRFSTEIVVRGRTREVIETAKQAVVEMLSGLDDSQQMTTGR